MKSTHVWRSYVRLDRPGWMLMLADEPYELGDDVVAIATVEKRWEFSPDEECSCWRRDISETFRARSFEEGRREVEYRLKIGPAEVVV